MARRMDTDDVVILSITNWTGSKAADNPDGGISSLKTWLENKSKRSIPQTHFNVQGEVVQIAIPAKDKRSFMHIDGWKWAGKDIKITEGQLDTPPSGPRNNSAPPGPRNSQTGFQSRNDQNQKGSLGSRITGGPSNNFVQNQSKELFGQPPAGPRGDRFGQKPNGNVSNANPFSQPQPNPFNKNAQNAPDDVVTKTLIDLIRKRYNPNDKFLNLGSLSKDPDIHAAGLNTSTADKVFAAIFVLCEQRIFETKEKRAEMVETISFKGNGLASLKEILPAASTFVMTKNLDLSDNKFSHIRDLTWWKKRFPRLEQIILSGNPVDSPQTKEEVKTWYRNLKTYNMQPLDAPWVGTGLPTQQLEVNPPVPTSSPAPGAGPNGQLLSTQGHPEFEPGSTFGLPLAGKSEEQLIKEQMGLKFSYETRLKMQYVEQCLSSNNFNYDMAINDLNIAITAGNVPADAFLQV